MRNTVVRMVDPDAESVEADLRAGRIKCPGCGSGLRPWGHARMRRLRDHGRPLPMQPRRSICPPCANSPGAQKTHVLLPKVALLRRADTVHTIGAALMILVMFPLFAAGTVGLTYLAEQVGRLIEARRRKKTIGPGL